MKNNKGVTIITLIITIIVIIILAGITIYIGLNQNTEKAMEVKTAYEVHEIIDAVVNRSLVHKINPDYYVYVGKTDYEPKSIGTEGNKKTYSGNDGWYLLDTKEEFDELGLDNTNTSYLVNYEDGSVVSINGVLYNDNVYYSLNDLKKDMGGGRDVLSDVEYDEGKRVNKPVLSKGMVPVKLEGNEWVVTSTNDDGWYDYSQEQMAWANVMLMDELEVEGYDNSAVKSASLSELVGKKVTTEGSAYVWLPRYTTTSLGASGSKIIFSNLTNDTTSADGETYYLPSSFTYGTGANKLELTGIWLSKYEASLNQ